MKLIDFLCAFLIIFISFFSGYYAKGDLNFYKYQELNKKYTYAAKILNSCERTAWKLRKEK